MVNPFTSRKFVYALTTLIVSVIYALLPSAGLSAESIAMLFDLLPVIGAAFLLLMGGHIAQDWKTTQAAISIKDPTQAAHELIEAVPLGERTE